MRARLIKSLLIGCLVFTTISCDQQEARRPVHQSKSQLVKNSVHDNQLRLAREVEIIEQWLRSQESQFSKTSHGIYYNFSNPKNRPILSPENLQKIYVLFKDLNGQSIYDWKIYQNPASNQDVPQGIILSLPYIPVGVESTITLNSFLAYGATGDGSLIGPYTPIVAHIYIPLKQNQSS